MELRNLQTFIRVAELQSFSKAAKSLGYSQAAVTIQIQQLEEELGTRLFERFHKSISLSEKGLCFFPYAQDILHQAHCACVAMQDSIAPSGRLRIGTIESLCSSIFPSLIRTYHKQYPKVTITLETSSPQQLLEALNKNDIDLVYVLDKPIYDSHWIKVMKEQEDVVFVCSPAHPITQKTNIYIADILQEDMILTEPDASYRHALEQFLLQKNLHLTPSLEVGNTDFIIQLLLGHEQISFLPYIAIAPYVEKKQLTVLHPQDVSFQIYRQMLYHKSKWITPQMQAFIDLAKKASA